jgi:glycine oxidase
MATVGSWDVVVVGGGIFGLCCAWACRSRGLSVAVIDKARLGSGASGGIVGAMAPHVPELWNRKKQFQLEALKTARSFWQEIDARSGLPSGYGQVGRLMPIQNAEAQARAQARKSGAYDLWGKDWDWSVLAQGHALIAASAAPCGVLHDNLSARIAPVKACRSLAAALAKSGVVLLENHLVEEIGTAQVSGPWGLARAGAIILASGVQAFEVLENRLGTFAGAGLKGQAALLDCDLRGQPQVSADGIFIVPHADATVAVGSTSERYWDTEGTDAKLDQVLEKARALCPPLRRAEVLQRWAGVRPRPAKRDPMLGPVPGWDGVYAATGAFKIGFGIAHRVGEVLADYATGKAVNLPPSFSVTHHIT